MMKKITIVGGGSLGHVIAGWLAYKGHKITVLTRNPDKWSKTLTIRRSDTVINASLSIVTDCPELAVKDSDIVLLTVPGYANESEIKSIRPYLKDGCLVGAVFCSSGFFFEALRLLPQNIKLWGFQRVPFIARVETYGHMANLLGTKTQLNIAVERATDK